MVADVVVDDRQPVEPCGAIARDRHDGRIRSFATTEAASPVVEAATARAPGSEARSLRHWSSATGCEWISRISESADYGGPDEAVVHGQDRLGDDRER